MGILLAFISCILAAILIPFAIIYECVTLIRFSSISDYFLNIAIAIDELGNVACQSLFNDTLRKKGGYKFGTIGETISGCLGVNEYFGTLTFLGKCVVGMLERIQPNHCRISINTVLHPEIPVLE